MLTFSYETLLGGCFIWFWPRILGCCWEPPSTGSSTNSTYSIRPHGHPPNSRSFSGLLHAPTWLCGTLISVSRYWPPETLPLTYNPFFVFKLSLTPIVQRICDKYQITAQCDALLRTISKLPRASSSWDGSHRTTSTAKSLNELNEFPDVRQAVVQLQWMLESEGSFPQQKMVSRNVYLYNRWRSPRAGWADLNSGIHYTSDRGTQNTTVLCEFAWHFYPVPSLSCSAHGAAYQEWVWTSLCQLQRRGCCPL